MVRVDYAGLNWKLIGTRENKCHTEDNCLGDLYYCKHYSSYFCSGCGKWLNRERKVKGLPRRPQTAIELLHRVEAARRRKNKES